MIQTKDTPLVSVCCITYNHEKYIRDALEGFIMQETTFPFEVLIHDDASTDHTADIIREYEAKYPDIIKPIYQTENQYSKGVNISGTYNFPRAKGKYIALCEGDDFWTDKHKLQIQAEFMEKNTDVTVCAHRRLVLNEIRKICYKDSYYDLSSFTSEEICRKLLCQELSFGTQAMMFKTKTYKEHESEIIFLQKNAPMGDMQLWVALTIHGKCAFLPKTMAVYRVCSNSVSHFDNEKKCKQFVHAALVVHRRIADFYKHSEWVFSSNQQCVCVNKSNSNLITKKICKFLVLLRSKLNYLFWRKIR